MRRSTFASAPTSVQGQAVALLPHVIEAIALEHRVLGPRRAAGVRGAVALLPGILVAVASVGAAISRWVGQLVALQLCCQRIRARLLSSPLTLGGRAPPRGYKSESDLAVMAGPVVSHLWP
jgi:hypothetical protein